MAAITNPRNTAEPPARAAADARTTLARSAVALVENLRAGGVATRTSPEGFSPAFQVCLPYVGTFVWHVGRDDVIADANQVLFVAAGEAFRISQPLAAPYAELIVTPSRTVVGELTRAFGRRPADHPLFRRRSRLADPWLQRRAALLVHLGTVGRADTLAGDETVLLMLRHALHAPDLCETPTPAAKRLCARAREYLQANLRDAVRVADIARAVGVSPTYLTDLFRRTQGVPMHHYLTRLRLAQALVELPHADDLTTLACDLGFSSHSHFTAVFRQAFGETPSAFREIVRRRRPSRGSSCAMT